MSQFTRFLIRHRRAVLAALIVFVAVIAAVVIAAVNAPATSPVQVTACVASDGGACVVFPTVRGANLLGAELTLPADFAGAYNLVVVSFDENQTARAVDWLPAAQELAGQYANFAYYSVPVLKAVNPVMRGFIMAGMLALIPNDDLRAITVMLFLEDKQAFLDALAVPDVEALQLFLLNARGEVLWRADGDFTAEKGAALRAELAQLHANRP